MHFDPSRKDSLDINADNFTLTINKTVIKQVTETKFLGVIIDNKLSWSPHIKQLTTKLRSCTGRLYGIKNLIPKHLHKDIYHTLFESHLVYGISVWGGVSQNKLKPLFTAQKKCIRLMFGDNEAYIDKFKTCVRVRPYGSQILGSEFYRKESTKPLFVSNDILTVHNLYSYYCILQTYKILKLRTPISLYSLFNRSQRKETLLLTPSRSSNFTYMSSYLWNKYRQSSAIYDFTVTICTLKHSLKNFLLMAQKKFDTDEWRDENLDVFSN